MSSPRSVLVVDDEAFVRESLTKLLAAEGWRTHAAAGVAPAHALLAGARVDVVVSDLRMPGGDVFALLERMQAAGDPTPVVVVTGVGTVREAVRAMKVGAFDFLQKPVDPDELLLLAERAAEHGRQRRELEDLRETVGRLRAPRVLVGDSPALRAVRERIERGASGATPVLLHGESGTGKELAAETLHAAGPLADLPLVRVLAPALGAEGDEGRRAEERLARLAQVGGSLLVDEVGSLGPQGQARLLAWIDGEGAARGVRVVGTTTADLEAAVRSGRLRWDLFWRLNGFPIHMPPLREHPEDVPALVAHFLAWAREPAGSPVGPATPAALELMAAYPWPGNVRELRNVLERSVILAGGRPLDAPLVREVLEPALAGLAGQAAPAHLHLRTHLDAAEKELVQRALAQADGLKKQAAHLLGIDPRNLAYYLRKHGLREG